MHKHKKAFTLVELIVTIAIIAILGTIAFISLQGYSTSARDSTRISDLSSMKTSLELFHLDAGKYPETTAGFTVTYSGTEVWTQGTFGETTKGNVEKLDKIPKDPLSEKEYTYSLTKTKQEYELAGLIEGDEITLNTNQPHPNPLLRGEGIKGILETNAAEITAKAIVTGNYNGALFKTETGTTCEVLSVPSIISSQGDTQTNLIEILEDKNLVYSGYNNLPSNYKGSKYKSNGGFEFESKKLVVYSDEEGCKPLYDGENPFARMQLVKNLQTAYSGTLIENSEHIRGLIALDISDNEAVNILSSTIINNNLGGELVVKKLDILICEDGKHTEDGINCIESTGICEIENGTGINTWNGTNWDCAVNTCNMGYTKNGNICNLGTYTVTFDPNGGTLGTTNVIATYNTTMPTLATPPTRAGYTFNGYYSETSGGTKYYNADRSSAITYTLTSTTTLYAQWTAINYTVTFNSNGGITASPATKSVAYNTAIGELSTTTKAGQIFNGWFTAASGGTHVTTSTVITGEVTFYAQWRTCVYTQCKIYIDDGWSFWASPQLITGTPGGMSTTLITTNFNGGSAYFNFYYNSDCGVYRLRMSGKSTSNYDYFEILVPGESRGRAGIPNTSYSSNESVCN